MIDMVEPTDPDERASCECSLCRITALRAVLLEYLHMDAKFDHDAWLARVRDQIEDHDGYDPEQL